VRHANDRRVWLTLRDRFPHPYTVGDAEAWIGVAGAQAPAWDFAIAVGDEAVGGIGLIPGQDVHRLSAELGYWLGQAFWGRGIATTAVRWITELAFGERGLLRVQAHVFEGNAASMRVLEKAGYQLEGILRRSVIKEGRILDQYLYAKVSGEG
jgi:RimJ/RimL family protein N-acetyltransferase